jgi:hypothetical protein
MMIGYFDATPVIAKPIVTSVSRLQVFEELNAKQQAKLSPELRKLAKEALTSDAKLGEFGIELRKAVPQLDRICWTAIEDNKLHIKRVAQEQEARAAVGGSGRKIDASLTSVATYAQKAEPVVNEKLASARGLDLKFMGRFFGSSVHVPAKIEGASGTLNFWSTESAAFPPEAVSLIKEAAELLQQ